MSPTAAGSRPLAIVRGTVVETDLDFGTTQGPEPVSQDDPEPQRSGIRIQKGMSAYDEDGDGMLDSKEVMHLIESKNQGDRTIANNKMQHKKTTSVLVAVLVVFFAIAIGAIIHSITISTEDAPEVSSHDELVAKDGDTIVMTAIATEPVPLYVIPVLPADVLLKMESITM